MDGKHAAVGVLAIVGLGVIVAAGAVIMDTPDGNGATTATPTATSTATPTPPSAIETDEIEDENAGGSGGDGGDGASTVDGSVTTEEPQAMATSTVTQTPTPKPDYRLDFAVQGTEPCGSTCRDVTVELSNHGAKTARNVIVTSEIYAGNDRVWEGTERIGQVRSGESITRTKRVQLGWMDAAAVKQNDGYVTIETTVDWDGGQRTFEDRQKVA